MTVSLPCSRVSSIWSRTLARSCPDAAAGPPPPDSHGPIPRGACASHVSGEEPVSSCGFLIWSRTSPRLSRGGLFKMSAGFSLLAFMAFAFKEKKKGRVPSGPPPGPPRVRWKLPSPRVRLLASNVTAVCARGRRVSSAISPRGRFPTGRLRETLSPARWPASRTRTVCVSGVQLGRGGRGWLGVRQRWELLDVSRGTG